MANLVNFFKNLLFQTHQSDCYQIWVPRSGRGPDVKLRRQCRLHIQKCVKMAVAQIPSKTSFSRPTCQNAKKFGMQHYGRVGILIILWKSCRSCDKKCVKMADLVNFWENCINSFHNLLLQTHLSECYQIWVTSLGQGHDVKLRRSCRSHDGKCVKMVD